MRARWFIAAMLVIPPAGSPFAQQSHLDIRYQIEQVAARFADHYDKQDAAALASMFTKDALRVSLDGTVVSAGPQAIEESFEKQFKTGLAHLELKVDQVSPSMRAALSSLIRSVGLRVEVFASPSEFLATKRTDGPSCLILDVRLPGLSGLEFQAELANANSVIPIIFITGHGDIPMSVKAMKAGAVEFLTKPFRDQDLLDAVQVAIERTRSWHESEKAVSELRARFKALTHREKEVMAWVTGGLLNKQVAAELGVSEITVKVHRGNVTRKMGAKSLVDLVRMANALHIRRTK